MLEDCWKEKQKTFSRMSIFGPKGGGGGGEPGLHVNWEKQWNGSKHCGQAQVDFHKGMAGPWNSVQWSGNPRVAKKS